jgi:hypothetical protein
MSMPRGMGIASMEASDHVPPPESSLESIRDLERDAAKKKRRTLVLLAVGLVLAAGIGGGVWVMQQRAGEQAIQKAWSEASACLVGAPLTQGERASVRMRSIQLVAVSSERDKSTEARWPSRCADTVAALFEALRRHGRAKDGLAARAEQFAVELRKAEVMTDISKSADGLFDAARELGFAADPVSLSEPTPEPAKAFTLDGMPESSRITPLQFTLDRVTATQMLDSSIHVLIHDRHVDPAGILCTFGAGGDDRCKPLGGELAGKAALAIGGTTDEGASPLVFVGRDGEEGIYRSDTLEKVAAVRADSAWSGKDGFVAIGAVASEEDGRFELLTQAAPGAPLKKETVKPEDVQAETNRVFGERLLWGTLLVGAYEDGKNALTLAWRTLPSGPKPAFTKLATIDGRGADLVACRTPAATIVNTGRNLWFEQGGKWSAPVPIERMPVFTCDGDEAVFTDGSGAQMRCTAAGCPDPSGGFGVSFLPFRVKQSYWADLGNKVLAVATTEDRGGVRFRHADGVNLGAKGTDRLLIDDMVKGGELTSESTVLGILLLSRGRFAVALVTTPAGVYAIRFDERGEPKPATIQR